MKSRKFSYPPIHIGTSLLLVILIALCMVVFSVLSLSCALKDSEYSTKNAQRTKEYYEACNQAEVRLSHISSKDFSSKEVLEFSVPINDTEILQVVLKEAPAKSPCYEIISWTKHSTENWTGSSHLPVLNGE